MENSLSLAAPDINNNRNAVSDEEILLRLYKTVKLGNPFEIENYISHIHSDKSLLIALWFGSIFSNQALLDYFLHENLRGTAFLAVYRENINDNLLAISAFLIAFGEDFKYFEKEIEEYIINKRLNYLTYSQGEYLIDKIIKESTYDRLVLLSKFKIRNVRMEELNLEEEVILFPKLLIKILMRKLLNNSYFIDSNNFVKKETECSSPKNKQLSKNSFKNQKAKKSIVRMDSRGSNLWNFKSINSTQEEKRDEMVNLITSLNSKVIINNFHEKNTVKINFFYYHRLEKILSSTLTGEARDLNPEYLKILLDDKEFSLIFQYFTREHLERLVLPVPQNFEMFYMKGLFNVSFFIMDRLEAQSVKMLFSDEIHEMIIDSFQSKDKEMFINYDVKLFILKCFLKNFSTESCKTLLNHLAEMIEYRCKNFLFNSSNSHMRIVLTAEIFQIISLKCANLAALARQMITDLSNIFNNIINSTDASITRPNLLERDFEERCVFDIIMENDMLDFLTTDVVKSIIIEEWNENMNNIHSTDAISSNSFIFHAIKTQFFISNKNMLPLFQDAIAHSRDNSREKQFYFQFYKWKDNIQHKFMFEFFGYLFYFILMFVLFIENLVSFSAFSETLKSLSNDKNFQIASIEDKNSFIAELNTFLSNTRSLYAFSIVLYAILAEYINKFLFSLKSGCRFSRLILDSWLIDILLLLIALLKDLYYVLIRHNIVCLLENQFMFSYNRSDSIISFHNFQLNRNSTLNNSDTQSQNLCEYFSELVKNTTNSSQTVIFFNLAFETKDDLFIILKHLFFIYRMIGISVSAFLLKLLVYFKLNPTIGPFLEIIKHIVKQFLAFCFLIMLIVFIATVFVNFCFFDIDKTFTNFWSSFVGLWEIFIGARTGSDYFTREDASDYLSFVDYEMITTLGHLFILIFTMIATVLILNLTIAMISTSYSQYFRASKAIYCKDIIKFKNSHIYSNIYDCLVRATFPFHLMVIPFFFVFLFVRDIQVIRIVNKLLNFFFFVPYLLGYLVFFILMNFAYYLINIFLSILLALHGLLYCKISFQQVYFICVYIFLGIYLQITDTVRFLKVCIGQVMPMTSKKTNQNYTETFQRHKSADGHRRDTYSAYHFYVSSFQHSEKDISRTVLKLDNMVFLVNFIEAFISQKIQLGYLIHGLCSKFIQGEDNNPRITVSHARRQNLIGIENTGKNPQIYSTFREVLAFFEVYKDGYIDCKSLYYSLKCILHNFLFKKILTDLNKRDYMRSSLHLELDISDSIVNFSKQIIQGDAKEFILLLENSTEIPFNLIGRDILLASMHNDQKDKILRRPNAYMNIDAEEAQNANNQNSMWDLESESTSNLKSPVLVARSDKNSIDEIPELSACECGDDSKKNVIEISEKVSHLEKKMEKMENMMGEMLNLLHSRIKLEKESKK